MFLPFHVVGLCISHVFFVRGGRLRIDPCGIAWVSVHGQIRGHNLLIISNEPRSEVCRITYQINKVASLNCVDS